MGVSVTVLSGPTSLLKKYTLINEAEGGAAAVDYRRFSSDMKYKVANTLDYEISQFLGHSSFKSDDLVIIWIGGNDYLSYHWTKTADIERVILEHVIQIRRIQRPWRKTHSGYQPCPIWAGLQSPARKGCQH